MLIELLVALALAFLCLLLHVVGILIMSEWLLHRRDKLEETRGSVGFGVILLGLFSLIMLLHLTEASLWGVFYYKRGLFVDLETSLYFSLGSYTTIGFGDVLLPQRWRLLAGIEAIAGVLLCGVSTAFIFAVMTAMVQMRIQRSGK
jgi:voltage-gated potassium channel